MSIKTIFKYIDLNTNDLQKLGLYHNKIDESALCNLFHPLEYICKEKSLNIDKKFNKHITDLFSAKMIFNLHVYHILYEVLAKYIIHQMTGNLQFLSHLLSVIGDLKSKKYIIDNGYRKYQQLCNIENKFFQFPKGSSIKRFGNDELNEHKYNKAYAKFDNYEDK